MLGLRFDPCIDLKFAKFKILEFQVLNLAVFQRIMCLLRFTLLPLKSKQVQAIVLNEALHLCKFSCFRYVMLFNS
jgi:hypothetical protein